MANRTQNLRTLIVIITLLFSLGVGTLVAESVARVLGFDVDIDHAQGVAFYVTLAIGLGIGIAITYVVANLLEGDVARVRLAVWGLGSIALAALVIWGGSNFIASTPAWALVVILLLVAILLKK